MVQKYVNLYLLVIEMELFDIEKELIAEKRDRCFYCGSKNTKTYAAKANPRFFIIECNLCNESSIF